MLTKNITRNRERQSSASHSSLLSTSQSDRGRLVYSSAFRRLQQKAQVFSLENNSAVRSRLTHSIEVSHIGRFIVSSIIEKIDKASSFIDSKYWLENSLPISNFVETSCLMHDIGNPPFGHFGESAITDWFKSEQCNVVLTKSFNIKKGELIEFQKKVNIKDFYSFDGNPQGLRIVTKLQGDDGKTGLNLTYLQLASFMKYVVDPEGMDHSKPFKKKIGFFSTEKEIVSKIYHDLSLPLESRHPLVFLMEAADDISYCISDIEDGIEKNVITENEFIKYVKKNFKPLYKKHNDSIFISKIKKLILSLNDKKAALTITPFLRFKTQLANYLVEETAETFISNYNDIINFTKEEPLISKGSDMYDALDVLRDFTREYIFSSYEAETIELSGYSIILGILNSYSSLLSLSRSKFEKIVEGTYTKEDGLDIQYRLYHRLPKKHIKSYINYKKNKNDFIEWNLRAHLIVDYISGMTDPFALEIYHMLKGIKVK
ncbi:dGTPase [Pectobacterium carotovorum]|uniref:dGTPase n=1 Tax=Pectobacterium carotovorum TaxID=554 RepID=UPI0021C31D01|nr:dGTPase [Pectobacterium carotovorum]GKW06701.1 deoxyguanosinetriphosphate triphosphohydrolase [Pectobacterium carotovorum subsp. carotovorum]